MLWHNPTYLWLIAIVAVVAVLLVIALRRRALLVQAFAEGALVHRLTPEIDRRRRMTRLVLRLLALTMLVIALAGPKWGFRWQEVRREGIDLIVALDTSRSMLATDVKPNRLERAKLGVLDLIKLLQGDRIGLVAFAGTAFLECPLTLDYAAFDRSLRSIEVGIIPRGGTALARAIDTSLAAFEARQGKHEALILITDGEDNEGNVEEAAQRAADRGVKIYSVGIGTEEGELLPQPKGGSGFIKNRQGQVVKSRLNNAVLEKVAVTTGGAYVRGAGASLGLDEVFRDHIAKMERREVASTLERQYDERFQVPLALALLLLMTEALMGERKGAVAGRRWRLPWRRGDAAQTPAPGSREQRGVVSPVTSRTLLSVLLLVLAPVLLGWLDPTADRAAEGNRLYASGKYDEAAAQYGEGLVDDPESALLQFNRSVALYKQGKYDEVITALNKVVATGNEDWVARAAYNLGNTYYQVGTKAAADNLQSAIASYEQALAAYKRAMAADPTDDAPKFNHELVTQQLAELKKKLEEQQKKEQEQQEQQQEQQQQDQPEQGDQQQQQDQPEQAQQPEQGQQPEQKPEEAEQEEAAQPQEGGNEEQGEEPSQPEQAQAPPPEEEPGKDQQAQGGADTTVGGAEPEQDMEKQAAHAVIDVARDEELGPEDIQRDVGVAGVGEAAQDW